MYSIAFSEGDDMRDLSILLFYTYIIQYYVVVVDISGIKPQNLNYYYFLFFF